MPKYLLQVSYTLEGMRGLRTEGGSARVAAVTAAGGTRPSRPHDTRSVELAGLDQRTQDYQGW